MQVQTYYTGQFLDSERTTSSHLITNKTALTKDKISILEKCGGSHSRIYIFLSIGSDMIKMPLGSKDPNKPLYIMSSNLLISEIR